MANKFILSLILILCVGLSAFAADRAGIEDRAIGSTFKTMAKAFVAMADMDKLKKGNIEKINSMDEEKFNKRYAKVYRVIKELPPDLKSAYGIDEQMTKREVIRQIELSDKKKLYKVIDAVPDEIIARQFKEYLNKKKQGIENSRITGQIKKFWSRVVEKLK